MGRPEQDVAAIGHRELVLTNWSDIISGQAIEGDISPSRLSSS